MAAIGRPKCSVWKYFSFCEDSNTSTCTVVIQTEGQTEKTCGKTFQGKYASNLRKHLKSCHPQENKKLEDDGKSLSENLTVVRKRSLSQLTLHNFSKYNEKDKKQASLTRRLAVFIGATNQPLSLVENEEFRELMVEADPRFVIPHRKKLHLEIEKVVCELKFKLADNLKQSRMMSLCTDIWSRPCMTASFLGITCHYFNHNDFKRHNITLAVHHFPSPHTADRVLDVFESAIGSWNISKSRVFRVLTDNGSNMIAAFNIETDSNEDDDTELVEEQETDDEDDEIDDLDNDIAMRCRDERREFERLEEEHQNVFFQYKRSSCVIHTLQLVVKIFEDNPCFRSTLKKAKGIVKKVNKSTKATEKLIQLAKKKLRGDCPTRWDSTFLMLERMVDVKAHLNNVLDELEWDNLSSAQWKQIESVLALLQPFAHYTNVTSSEETTSICMVLPLLKELSLHLEEVS